jgi:hypothetical protein
MAHHGKKLEKNFKLLNEVMGRSMSEVDGKIRERGGRGVP